MNNTINAIEETPKTNAGTANVLPIFARHETFHPRYGWLKKGFDNVLKDENIFHNDDATSILGVGKNMVRAIRYWCSAFKILNEYTKSEKACKIAEPSEFGIKLLSDNGYDPYLESPGSLWLLHWHLLKNPCYATTWSFVFNHFNKHEFSSDSIYSALILYKNENLKCPNISDDSLRRDISCLLKMYTDNHSDTGPREDTIDSPFVELGLIKHLGESDYYFNIGHKNNLPGEIIVYACLDFMSQNSEDSNTISLTRLQYDKGSPGQAFKISQENLYSAIERQSDSGHLISINDTAGITQMSVNGSLNKLKQSMLDNYYTANRLEVCHA
jgi:hypothetical protein